MHNVDQQQSVGDGDTSAFASLTADLSEVERLVIAQASGYHDEWSTLSKVARLETKLNIKKIVLAILLSGFAVVLSASAITFLFVGLWFYFADLFSSNLISSLIISVLVITTIITSLCLSGAYFKRVNYKNLRANVNQAFS